MDEIEQTSIEIISRDGKSRFIPQIDGFGVLS